MVKMIVLIGATAGGALGWWIGSRFGIMAAFALSVIGTAAGVYFARRWAAGFQ